MISVFVVLLYGLLSAVFCVVVGFFCRAIALRFAIVDHPTGGRKIHTKNIPLLGGLSCIITFFVFVSIAFMLYGPFEHITLQKLLVIGFASLLIAIVGVIDDAVSVKPMIQFVCTLIAVIVTVIGVVELKYITNPWGGLINLQSISWNVGNWIFFPLSLVFSTIWLMLISHVTKVLDGLDGLVSGTVAIGALMITIFSLSTKYYQPETALLASIVSGSACGFLWWNHYPARMFLGNSGSVWLGYILGVLAIISGGKIAIAMLTLGVPVIDMMVVVLRRIIQRQPIFKGDATHLHFQLMHLMGHKKTVYVYWFFSVCLGAFTLFAQSGQKMLGFMMLTIATSALIFGITKLRTSH